MDLEFQTVTFLKDENQPVGSKTSLIYFLLAVIFILLGYILSEMGVDGWLIWVLFISGLVCFYLMSYHDWGRKEKVNGSLDKKLAVTPNSIQIGSVEINVANLEKMEFEIDRYDNQKIYYFHVIRKSEGVSNRISITTQGKTYTEFFRIGSEIHLMELYKVIRELKKLPIEVDVKSFYTHKMSKDKRLVS